MKFFFIAFIHSLVMLDKTQPFAYDFNVSSEAGKIFS